MVLRGVPNIRFILRTVGMNTTPQHKWLTIIAPRKLGKSQPPESYLKKLFDDTSRDNQQMDSSQPKDSEQSDQSELYVFEENEAFVFDSMESLQVTISKEVQFDAGHRVPNHKSKCRSPHGHRYRVVVYCTGYIVTEPGASDEGMLVDFGDLKAVMVNAIHDPLDHSFIIWEGDNLLLECFQSEEGDPRAAWKIVKFPYIPTAENIARWCYYQLEERISNIWNRNDLMLSKVEVWETPTSMAYYEGV